MGRCNRCTLARIVAREGQVVLHADPDAELGWYEAVRVETTDGRFLAWFGELGDRCECD